MKQEYKKFTKLIFAISRTLYPKHHPFWFIFYMYVWYIRTIKRNYKYSVRSVPLELMKKLTHNYTSFKDINNTIAVNINNIYNSDRILRLCCDQTKDSRIIYPVPVTNCAKHEILVSNTLYHNFPIHSTNYVRLLNYNFNQVKIAEEINISLISGPFDISNSLSDTLIKRFFERPKLVCKNDILELDIKYIAEDIFLLNTKANEIQSIFYKCNKIIYESKEVTDCYYCVFGETTVSQGVNIQSFIPKTTVKVLAHKEYLKELPLYPYGLKEYFHEIHRAAKPFLGKPKIALKPAFLLVGNSGSGKNILVSSLASQLGMHYYKIDNHELVANIYAQNETKLHNSFFNAKMAAPCIVGLHNFESFGKNNEGQHDDRILSNFLEEVQFLLENNQFPVLLFCCSNKKDIPSDLKKVFLQTFNITAPTNAERENNLKWILEGKNLETNASLFEIANKTQGFFFNDLRSLIYYAKKDSNGCENTVSESSINEAIDYMQKNYNESIGAPKVPKILWSDVGGLNDVKEEISKTINFPLKCPEMYKTSGLKRSGILLFGPPGTGKTLIAKAVATECNLCFLSVKGPELLNMYVGQSEQNIREVFEKAREASPCIIFFDELDSLAPNRGISGDSGGVMDRVVSQLLAEMDGLNESATVFIIGATNRPDLIDPALLRPGRFDKLLYIGPCTDDTSKVSVLKALTRKFKLDDNVNLSEVVKVCPKNVTGADFYGICSNAWLFAVDRLVGKIENGEISPENATAEDVVVSFDDFKKAMVDVKPSITPKDLLYFEQLRKEIGSNL